MRTPLEDKLPPGVYPLDQTYEGWWFSMSDEERAELERQWPSFVRVLKRLIRRRLNRARAH